MREIGRQVINENTCILYFGTVKPRDASLQPSSEQSTQETGLQDGTVQNAANQTVHIFILILLVIPPHIVIIAIRADGKSQ